MSFLRDLLARIAAEAGSLPEAAPLRDAIRQTQGSDGGWPGRSGESDPYWTGFALRCAHVLGIDDQRLWRAAATYLQRVSDRTVDLIDGASVLLSLVLVQRSRPDALDGVALRSITERLLAELEQARTPEGGYRKSRRSASGSTYATFLAHLCYEELHRPMPQRAQVVRFLLERQQPDGGFFEVRAGKLSGTNPTAAALVTLRGERDFDTSRRRQAVRFLLELYSPLGGFCANRKVPLPDLLSTFTALAALDSLGITLPEAALEQTEAFARSLQRPDGGFSAAPWDLETDPEYSFYAIGTLALARLMRCPTRTRTTCQQHR